MTRRTAEERLRRLLLVLAGAVLAGAVVELMLAEHTESFVQLVPFGLCAIGLPAVGAALAAPRPGVLRALRVVMGLAALGGLYGVYEHVEHNVAFELEIRPGATAGAVFWDALHGASPALAPGILILAAALAVGATLDHPSLARPPAP